MALTDYSVKDLLLCIGEVEEEKEQLKKENKKLKQDLIEVCIHEEMLVRENNSLKEELTHFKARSFHQAKRNKELAEELTTIKSMSMFEFGNTYCSDESLEADGRAFAKSLLGGA